MPEPTLYLFDGYNLLRQSGFEERREYQSAMDERRQRALVTSLTENLPPLPNFSSFHEAFVPDHIRGTPAGDLRTAYFLAYDDTNTTYEPLGDALARCGTNDAERTLREGDHTVERDGADNLFIVADGSGRSRLIMEIEAPREAFGEAERPPEPLRQDVHDPDLRDTRRITWGEAGRLSS